jgi:hypothetical protein
MFNNNPYPYVPQGPAYQRPAFQPMYQPMQPAMMQDGNIQARFVSGREEAVASNVMPGSMFLFHDRANGMIYSKLIDPQTGMPDFRIYAEVQPEAQQAPQYATVEALNALRGEFEQIIDQRVAALTAPRTAQKKGVNSNDE